MDGGWLPQDRAARIGLIVSGIGHLALILWALLGGIFFTPDEPPPPMSMSVSTISSTDFAALEAAAPTAATESPPQPSAPEQTAEATPPEPKPEKPPEQTDPTPPEPTQTDAAPDVTDVTPPGTEVTDTPPTPTEQPPAEPSVATVGAVSPRPKPKPADRVSPQPVEAPAPDANVSDTAQEQTQQQPSEEQPKPQDQQQAEAPPESGDVLKTEANAQDTLSSAAPLKSGKPKPRPAKKPAPEPTVEEPPAETQTASADTPDPAEASDAAVNDALAEALSGAASEEPQAGSGTAESGPPLTGGEKDGFLRALSQCWNLGSLSTDAMKTIVTVGFDMSEDGKPVGASIQMVGSSGGTNESARQAYEAARRAVLRCGAKGFPLPSDKYSSWQRIEVTFDPTNMRLR